MEVRLRKKWEGGWIYRGPGGVSERIERPGFKVQSLAKGKKVIDLPVVCGSSGAEVVTVRMIPGDQYNFVPSGNGQGLKKKDIRILHYKGGKKEGMYVPYKAMQKNVKDVFKLKKLVV